MSDDLKFSDDEWLDLSKAHQPVGEGLKYKHNQSGQEFMVLVHDKFPELGETHIEGRRYVEVSVEMFDAMMHSFGWEIVPPDGYEEFTEDEV